MPAHKTCGFFVKQVLSSKESLTILLTAENKNPNKKVFLVFRSHNKNFTYKLSNLQFGLQTVLPFSHPKHPGPHSYPEHCVGSGLPGR